MTTWRRTTSLTESERLLVLHHLDRIESSKGREAIDEVRRRRVVHHENADHFLFEGDELLAYAQGSHHVTYEVEMAGGGLTNTLLSSIRERPVDVWIRGDEPFEEPCLVVRTLDRMTCDITDLPAIPKVSLSVRTFQVGRDEELWLRHNNAAFASHPEQGAWTREDLTTRVREPWFDPSGFLLFFEGEHLVASCWTKIHELSPRREGEIYVIATSPGHGGRGFGRFSLLTGLHSLRSRGVQQAFLFVESSNIAAQSLYRSIGFQQDRRDALRRYL
jgi:mycothiol synthase